MYYLVMAGRLSLLTFVAGWQACSVLEESSAYCCHESLETTAQIATSAFESPPPSISGMSSCSILYT